MMKLGSVARVFEVVGAFLWCEVVESIGDCSADGIGGSGGSLPQKVFELGEDLLDRVEVRRVFRQEEEPGSHRADQLADGFALMAAKIVQDDNVTGAKCRQKNLLDVETKALAIDGALDKPWRIDAIVA